jgi:hypothetical protein
VLSPIAKLLRLASLFLCLVVGASFLLFAVNRTGSASAHQQRELNNEVPPEPAAPATGVSTTASGEGQHAKGTVRKAIDDVARAVTSPFSVVTDRWSSEWLRRSVLLLLTLLVYGFGLGFLARMIRVRL